MMPNTQGKSKVPGYSKKLKVIGTSSSSYLTTTTHHRYLTFDQPPYEERYQHLRVISLGLGWCIDWEALQTVGLYALVYTLLDATPREQFFAIVKPTYVELTLDFFSTLSL
ncbi:hypothetical protein Goklo_017552 [Gossypium klotzschianum]|uniref:Uncharacterized protein n=1 Tax=Gossypium klotzschianum TaxID=34286 RepID=A0A7J8UHW6_9ROSI|nr:hypothetical protein [Gossypium klotzschianum]